MVDKRTRRRSSRILVVQEDKSMLQQS